MQVTILGATGRTGVPLVAEALTRGHHLTALVRDQAKAVRLLPADHERLTIHEGDATDPRALEDALAGSEAVVDVTGPVKGGPKRLRAEVVGHLLPAMERQGVKRLVFLTGAGVRVEGDQPKLADRAIRGLMSVLQGEILEDGQAAVAAVAAAPLEWTVVRVPRLTDAEPRGEVRAVGNVGGDSSTQLGRSDLARFLVDELEGGTWSGRAPVVSR